MARVILAIMVLCASLFMAKTTEASATSSTELSIRQDTSPSILTAQLIRPRSPDTPAAGTPPPARPKSLSTWQRGQIWLRTTQQQFYRQLTQSLKDLREHGSLAAGWSLALVSFLYGIFHAAGPGHGKAVISAYLLANERQLRRGIQLAFLSSLLQALSAIVLVSGALLFARTAFGTTRMLSRYLELASYLLIALIGAMLLWRSVRQLLASRRAEAFAPAYAGATAQGSAGNLAPGDADHHHHDHSHHHHHHHDDACGCSHSHMPGPEATDGDWSLGRALAISFTVGLRPCSGALIVLIFAASTGIYAAGIGATFAMALGTAITVSTIAMLAVGSRGLAFRLAGGSSTAYRWMTSALSIFGGATLLLLGIALFQATISAPVNPLM